MTDPAPKSRKFPVAETVGIGALVISGLGLWNSWQSGKPAPTEVIERKQAVPLVLRGHVEDEGRKLVISPVEASHALESLDLGFPGGTTINVGGDGVLTSDEVRDSIPDPDDRKGDGRVLTQVTAHYVEAGTERTSKRRYAIAYRWEGGGLLSGKKLRLTGFARA